MEGERLIWPATPVPVRLTVCGLPPALSEMLKVAERFPTAVGVNVTLIVQLPLGATVPLLTQLSVSPKSPGLAPVIAMLMLVKFEFPVLVNVTV